MFTGRKQIFSTILLIFVTNVSSQNVSRKKERYLAILPDKPSSTKTYFLFRLPVVLAVMQLLTLQKPLLAVVVL